MGSFTFAAHSEKMEDRIGKSYSRRSLSFGLLPSINFTDKIEVKLFRLTSRPRMAFVNLNHSISDANMGLNILGRILVRFQFLTQRRHEYP